MTVLSRLPTPDEVRIAEEYGAPVSTARPSAKPARPAAKAKPPVKRPADWVDITWALINSPEFLYKH